MKRGLKGILLAALLITCWAGCKKEDAPGQDGVSMHIYGTDAIDLGSALVQTSDGGFAIAGSMTNVEDSLADEDLLLIRTNGNGELIWKKTFPSLGRDRAEDMLLLADGGFLIVGQQADGLLGNVDLLVMRTDAAGEVVWSRNFGGAREDFGTAIIQTTDGNFVAVGYTASLGVNASAIYPNLLAVKLDENGNEIWTKAYGGTNEERAFGVSAMADGGVAIVGNVYFDSLDYDAGLWKLAANGDSLWAWNGITPLQDEGHGILTLANGNVCVVGYASYGNDFDIFVQEITDAGSVVAGMQLRIGGDDYDRTIASRPIQLNDGSVVLVGYTMSFGNGANDYYLAKLNRQSTYNVQWTNTFGGSNDDIAKGIIPTANGGFALIGYTKSFSFNEQYDIALVVTNSVGELVPGD
jgi:hypothetical protein